MIPRGLSHDVSRKQNSPRNKFKHAHHIPSQNDSYLCPGSLYQAAINTTKLVVYRRVLVYKAHMSQTMQKMATGSTHSQNW